MEKRYYIQESDFSREELIAWCAGNMPVAPHWEKEILAFILDWFSDKEAIEVNTSGSTGEPKSILLTKEAMRKSAGLTAKYFSLGEKSSVLLALPVHYIAGKMVVVRALVNGWRLYWAMPSSNPLAQWDKKIDFTSFTPMQVHEILQYNPSKYELISKVLIGGGVLSAELEERLSHLSNESFITYGMTETITHVAVRKVGDEDELFHALPGVQFTTEDDCLVIKADHLGNDQVRTNDIVELPDARTFRFIGRKDNVINSGGIKLFPEKIEAKISAFLDAAFFIGKEEDPILGEKAILYIEGEAGSEELIKNITAVLGPYEMPKQTRYIKQFERTETGKIKRKNYLS